MILFRRSVTHGQIVRKTRFAFLPYKVQRRFENDRRPVIEDRWVWLSKYWLYFKVWFSSETGEPTMVPVGAALTKEEKDRLDMAWRLVPRAIEEVKAASESVARQKAIANIGLESVEPTEEVQIIEDPDIMG